jgi:hypothetical protein
MVQINLKHILKNINCEGTTNLQRHLTQEISAASGHTVDPPLYASKWNSNNNGTFSGSFVCLKMIKKNGNFQKRGKVPYLGPQNFVGPNFKLIGII